MVLSIEEWLRQSKPDGRVSKSGMWEGEDSTGCGGNAHACGICHQFFADEQTAGKFKDELDISCQADRDEGHVNTTHQVNIPQALISFLMPLMIARRMLVIYSRFYRAQRPRQGLRRAGREL